MAFIVFSMCFVWFLTSKKSDLNDSLCPASASIVLQTLRPAVGVDQACPSVFAVLPDGGWPLKISLQHLQHLECEKIWEAFTISTDSLQVETGWKNTCREKYLALIFTMKVSMLVSLSAGACGLLMNLCFSKKGKLQGVGSLPKETKKTIENPQGLSSWSLQPFSRGLPMISSADSLSTSQGGRSPEQNCHISMKIHLKTWYVWYWSLFQNMSRLHLPFAYVLQVWHRHITGWCHNPNKSQASEVAHC